MEEYKPNSHRYKTELSKEPQKKTDKIVTGKVRTKKKGGVSKLSDVFINEDVANVKSYILTDILIPTIQKTILDIVTGGLEMSFYGNSNSKKRRSGTRESYQNYYYRNEAPRRSYGRRHYVDDIILDSRGEAEEVLSLMDELIDKYGAARIADLYDAVGITGSHTDYNYGWTNLRSASVVRTIDGGYMLKLPREELLD